MALSPTLSGSFDPASAQSTDTRSLFGSINIPQPQDASPPPPQGPGVGIDEATNTIFVNGFTFNVDDHDSALKSKDALVGPPKPLPANFRPVDAPEFTRYIRGIRDPSLGRVLSKRFGSGVDNLQKFGANLIRFAGSEDRDAEGNLTGLAKFGAEIAAKQDEDLRFSAPYQKSLSDIKSVGDAGMWFAGTLAEQGPNLIESLLSALAGAAVGTAAGGPIFGTLFGAIGGLALKFAGKQGLKAAVITAAKKKVAGEVLEGTEQKLLQEMAVLALAKKQRALGGAAAGSLGSNFGIGVADIFGEQLDANNVNKSAALGLGVVYASLESLPEFFALGFLAKGAKTGIKGNKLRRGISSVRAAATGAVGEGATEAGQEALLISQNPQVNLSSREGISRLIESFAAGAAVGGTLTGGAAILRRGPKAEDAPIPTDTPTDVLRLDPPRLGIEGPQPESADPTGPTGTQELPPGPPAPLELQGPPVTPEGQQERRAQDFNLAEDQRNAQNEPVDILALPAADTVVGAELQRAAAAQEQVAIDQQNEQFNQVEGALVAEQAGAAEAQRLAIAKEQEALTRREDGRFVGPIDQESLLPNERQAREQIPKLAVGQGFLPFAIRKRVAGSPRKPGPASTEPVLMVVKGDTLVPVPVEEILQQSNDDMNALEELAACLRK